MSEKEYIREGFYNLDSPVSEDVLFEQKKINEADTIVLFTLIFGLRLQLC